MTTSRPIPLGAFATWTDDAQGEPYALARRVVDALTAGTQPDRLVVFVDDAHLLDDLSALVLAPGLAGTAAIQPQLDVDALIDAFAAAAE